MTGLIRRAMRWPGRATDRMLFEEYRPVAAGLPGFRILLALLFLLFVLPSAGWIVRLPDSFLDPAPGPFLLLHQVPPAGPLLTIELARVAAVAALLVGWRTPTASVATAMLTMCLYGLNYSFGKIDHTILIALTPLLLASSGWGGRWSVDALRGRRPPARAWSPALLATAVGAAYATAGIAKFLGGWLRPATQATQQYVLRAARLNDPVPLGPLVEQVDLPMAWELLDVATVGLEIGLLVLALRRGWFRAGLVALIGFHVGIFLMMGIDFSSTVYVYAAFLPWDRALAHVDRFTARASAEARTRLVYASLGLAVVPVAIAVWSVVTNKPPYLTLLRATVPDAVDWATKWPLVVAALVATTAVIRTASEWLSNRSAS